MRKFVLALGISIVILIAAAFVLWNISNSRSFQFFGEIVPRVETQEQVIALTFDDGPMPQYTDEILAILAEENVKATFFLVGSDIGKHPDEARKIAEAGHELGNHSFSHKRMVLVGPAFVKDEIEKTDELIRAAGYTDKPILFRPPYGKKLFVLPYFLSETGRKSIMWDVESESYTQIKKDPEEIVRDAVASAQNGSIILLHVMHDKERRSMRAVRPIITGLKEKGFRFVTVSEMIE